MKNPTNPNERGSVVPFPQPGQFFDSKAFATLSAACARLIPQPEREPFIGVAKAIDHRLAEEKGGRWPANAEFLDGNSFLLGIRGLNESSQARLRRDFAELDPVRQDQILQSLQNGTILGSTWAALSPRRFFEELLSEATEIYHSAPATEEAANF